MLATVRSFYRESRQESVWLRTGCYPDFVTAREPPALHLDVPVFVFHSIDEINFEAQLAFLAENGYATLTGDQFLCHLTGEQKAPPRSVLLTIDDGRASVWSFGLPLLEKYCATAVVFLIPGFIPNGRQPSETIADVWSGRWPAERVRSRDPELMSWIEIEAAAGSGRVDFQSHTLYHHKVPVTDRIVDYVNPAMRSALFDLPIEPGQEETLLNNGIESLYGAPLYEHDSLMSGRPRFRGDAALSRACVAHVAAAGGASYFRSAGWRSELDRVVAEWQARYGARGALEDRSELHDAIVDDLLRARQLIEKHVPGHRVRHLCLPYTIGSPQAVRAARETGYATCFWGVLPDRKSNRPGEHPYRCPRLKADYIFRLPGRGRRSIGAILSHKLARRLSGRPVY
jgi:peptidoglycan/xylan/chitin deacetylase (PgdA/CDA1 family)